MKNWVLILICLRAVRLEIETGFCDSKTGCEEGDSRNYNLDSNFYTKTILDALHDYVSCSQANCSCHLDVMKEDLAPYKNGITKEMIDGVRDRGTKYQIIDHR